jgi:tRNA pseudouridine55 synthase
MSSNSSVLLVNKPTGVTSFTSLNPIKRIIDKKVGHAGTLDRFAEGLMIILTGTFTKLNPLFMNLDKRYQAQIYFGVETDTLDPEGAVVAEAPVPSIDTISEVIKSQFIGPIEQIPPSYSAVHVQGKRAYALARAGESVTLTPRNVTIHNISILSWNAGVLTIDVHCSKGTYIRSLARDIALACNSRGHLIALIRTEVGPFSLDEAVGTTDFEILREHAQHSVNRIERIPGMGTIVLTEEASLRMTYGNLPTKHGIMSQTVSEDDQFALVFNNHNTLLAVVGLQKDGMPKKIFALPGYGEHTL